MDPPITEAGSLSSRGDLDGYSCNKCGLWKPLESYKRLGTKKSGEHYYTKKCKECIKIDAARKTLADSGSLQDSSIATIPGPGRGSSEAVPLVSSREMTEMRRMQFAERMMEFVKNGN